MPSLQSGLAEPLLTERLRRVGPLERLSEANRRTLGALDGLRAPTDAVRRAAQSLPSDGVTAIDMRVTSSNENVATGQASPSAPQGPVAVVVSQLASGSTYAFAGGMNPWKGEDQAILPKLLEANPAKARTITVTIGSDSIPEEIAIELTSSTTLSEFITSFNEKSSRAEAEIVNRGTTNAPDYAISIRSTRVGLTLGSLDVQLGKALLDPNGDGSGDDSPFSAAVLTQATNTTVEAGGIPGVIERDSNTIDDLIEGVSLTLGQVGSATITISPDPAPSIQRLRSLVDAINDLTDFQRDKNGFEQAPASVGGGALAGPLRATGVDELLIAAVRTELRGVSTTGGLSIAELGITTNRDGSLTFDEAVFQGAVLSDPARADTALVRLAARLGDDGGGIDRFDGSTGLIASTRSRVEGEIVRYESTIAAIERLIGERNEALSRRYSRLDGAIAKLSSQGSVLGALFGSTGTNRLF